MKRDVIIDRVRTVVADTLGIIDESTIPLDASFEQDLGATSLDLMQLVCELEDGFQVDIDVVEHEGATTVQDVVDCLERVLECGEDA